MGINILFPGKRNWSELCFPVYESDDYTINGLVDLKTDKRTYRRAKIDSYEADLRPWWMYTRDSSFWFCLNSSETGLSSCRCLGNLPVWILVSAITASMIYSLFVELRRTPVSGHRLQNRLLNLWFCMDGNISELPKIWASVYYPQNYG